MGAALYRFGNCELDLRRRQLFVDSTERHLSPKAFTLLELLIRNRPTALSKEALYDAIWPDTFVTESNLAGLAAEIRAATGDEARTPRFIRTVHAYGYAFCGDATEVPEREVSRPRRKVGRLFCGSRELDLLEGENVIGREAAHADLIVSDSTVSRRHAVVFASAERTTITDCGSKNGTFVSGRRVSEPTDLADGSELRVGSVTLIYRTAAAADQQTITYRGDLQSVD